MGNLLRDVRHGLRLLTKNPGFALAAVLSLSLGIGANSALFSMFNSLLWRPLPVAAPEQIAQLLTKSESQTFYDWFSYPEYQDYREQNGVFQGLAAFSVVEMSLSSAAADDMRAYGEIVSGNYFQLLGVRPQLGRGFVPEEDQIPGAHPVAVLSHRLWQRRFGSDPDIVGKTISLNRHSFTVVGVAPAGFNGVYAIYFAPDLWVPLMMLPQVAPSYPNAFADRSARIVRLMGRLKPGVSMTQAGAAVSTIASRLQRSYPETNKGIDAFVFPDLATRPEVEMSGPTNAVAMIFLGLTAIVLLIACSNVANLMLARATARRREIAVRLALGAGRLQLIRQLLTESVLLALIAGAAGLFFGFAATRMLASFKVPTDLPLVLDFHTDARVVLFTLGVSLVAGVIFGLAPALQASRPDLVPALKGEAPLLSKRHRRLSLSNVLVVAQVALSLVLLVAAGLFLRSIGGARTIDPGFKTERRLLVSFNPSLQGYDQQRTEEFHRGLLERVRALPGVQSATLARYVPLDFSIGASDVLVEGRTAKPGEEKIQTFNAVVEPDYFRTLGTPIQSGRGFTERDNAAAPGVVIVNETMARLGWPGQSPIGRRLRLEGTDSRPLEVVGIVADGKYRQLIESPRSFILLPLAQNFRSGMTLVVHTAGEPGGMVASIRREVRNIDPEMPMFDVKTMDQFMDRAMMGPRLCSLLIGPAGLLALVIASIGLYGVMAYSVSQRTREVGIRVAVGARPADVIGLVMRQGLTLAGVGLTLGLAAALAATRLIANLLYGVSATDPLIFVSVPALLAAVAALATLIPARAALKVDPLIALRQE